MAATAEPRAAAEHDAEHREERVVVAECGRARRRPRRRTRVARRASVQVQARVGDAAGDRGRDVEEVAVPIRPRAEDAVAERDRVRLAPRHLLAERRPRIGQLIRRAGEGRPRAERAVAAPSAAGRARPVAGRPGTSSGWSRSSAADVERRRDARPAHRRRRGGRRSRSTPRRGRGTSRRGRR